MGVVSRRWMWVESMGVVVRRYRLPHITYPYSSCICSFLQQHPYPCSFFNNVFRSLTLLVHDRNNLIIHARDACNEVV